MAKDLLLEIGAEEIPARFMPGALARLASLAAEKLDALHIAHGEIKTMGTPRRIALLVRDAAERQADRRSENKGPSVKIAFDAQGAPTKAAQGFARGQGVDAAALVVKDGYVYAQKEEKGRPVAELLPELLPELIYGLNFPKNMRWGDLDLRFVRPIKWLMALFGQDVAPFTVAGVASGGFTYGHRFMSAGPVAVASPADYEKTLLDHFVIVDPAKRRADIRGQVEKLAVAQGGAADIDEELLEEVLYLVEYPTALAGSFEKKYLKLPPETVITPMREHQRYFPVLAADGKLLPFFITVRNGGGEHLDVVRRGNERVLRARLADAAFFFAEDCKTPLGDRLEKLKTVVFQEGLGTVYDKTQRIEKLAAYLAAAAGVDPSLSPVIGRAAQLSKADLVTGMVCEFTELQGTMGREYARLSGEDEAVAEAIFEHYLPRFAGDILPATPAGRIVGIADKMDNIAATFSRGLIPTGSQDPYALRRQALGVVHTLIEAGYSVSLRKLALASMELLGIEDSGRQTELCRKIEGFFTLRLKNVLGDARIRHDIVDAVLAAGADDLYDAWLRARAVAAQAGRMEKAVQAFVRVGNLARQAGGAPVLDRLFSTESEKTLYRAYEAADRAAAPLLRAKDYAGVLAELARLADPIDEFFAHVMVMVEDEAVRANRLSLLKAVAALTNRVADFGKMNLA